MAIDKNKLHYCEKCCKTLKSDNFYVSNNLEKYTDEGMLNMCKSCVTMHVDNWNPETYMWILQEVDVPYIPEEWNKLMASYARDRSKVTGTTILGRYLSKMKLKQWKEYRYKDTEFLQDLANAKIKQTMQRQGYDAAQITEAIQKATFSIPEGELQAYVPPQGDIAPWEQLPEPEPEEDLGLELTDEDRMYLRLKWGKNYKPDEWVQLEKLYNEMMDSYDIQSAGHIDTLKLVCKTSLKANQLVDLGDIEGFQKMSKVYDQLMKSGKFTAAQNKAESGEYVDSISELVAICETDGFIPRYHIDEPMDKADRVLQDLQSYTRTLITEEMNLGTLIESAVKQIEIDKEKEADSLAEAADDEEAFENELFNNVESFNLDKDFEDFNDMEDELEALNTSLFKKLESGEL